MTINIAQNENQTIVEVEGRLDTVTAPDLEKQLSSYMQANGVDLVWIILDLIQEWVGGSLELCKGRLMIWLLSDSAVTHSSGLIAQPL